MAQLVSSPPSVALNHLPFHVGVVAVNPTTERKTPIEEIVAEHTARKPSQSLAAAYGLESIVTGVPLLLVDASVTGCGLVMTSLVVNATQGLGLSSGIWIQVSAVLLLQWLLMSIHQLYPGAGVSPVTELRGIVRSTSLALIALSGVNALFGQLPRIEFVTFVLTGVVVSATLPLARWSVRRLLARTSWWGIRILLIGERNDCLSTYQQLLDRRSSGFIPVGYTCDQQDVDKYAVADHRLLGDNSDALAVATHHMAPIAGLVSPHHESNQGDQLIYQFPSIVWIEYASAARRDLDVSNLPQVFSTRLDMPFIRFMPRLVKRCIDLAICIPTLLLLTIPMLMIAWIIKHTSPGPALYAHTRIGQHGVPFQAWKFRTMVTNADTVLAQHLEAHSEARSEWERDQKLKNDPRVIGRVGKLLRKWSLDELPQLWNVLVGEMSLVGPRPIVYSEIAKYSRDYLAYSRMMPGITGLWQISGRNNTSYQTRVAMDQHYARNWSPWLDLWVLIKTPIVVITGHGAY